MEQVRISVMIYKDELEYLKSKGINRSAFVRQAITALKYNKWQYNFLKK